MSGVAALLMPCVVAYAFAPNLNRMLVQKRVEGLGGFVETSFDAGDGLWFPFEDVYLPRVFHESPGESFFGRITKVRLDACRVNFGQVRDLNLLRSIDGLNLSGAQISPNDLARVIQVVDVRSLELSALPVSEHLLMLCGIVPSLEWLNVTGTNINDESARRFAEQFPRVTLLYGRKKLQIRKGRHLLR